MTHETILIALASILFLGIGAQYLAWRFNLPAILFLLVLGFFAGPITGFLNPDLLFGKLLMPVVSLLVAIILFEGGLSLRFREIRETGQIVMNLLTVGLLTTWCLVTISAFFIFKFDIKLCVLLGAVLTVTGPTVIGPLLQRIQPSDRVNNILKWEGIVVDPLGALLTILTFETIIIPEVDKAWFLIIGGILKTTFVASCIGVFAAVVLIVLMSRYWIPDGLHGVFSLMLVAAAFTLANLFQSESGLWAVTIMGIVMANQQKVPISHIEELKEHLRTLFISSLFIILGARFKFSNFAYFDINSAVFLTVLILLVRPLSVFLATARTQLNLKEKLFISWMAPRGIVAAAVSSLFAIRLQEFGYTQAQQWEALIFFVIIFTVLVYGLTAKSVAKKLHIANPNPQGILFIGAHAWARAVAKALKQEGIKVLLLDTNPKNVKQAQKEGLVAFQGNGLADNILYDLPLNGIGYLIALTPNHEANSLIVMNFMKLFGRARVFQVHPDIGDGEEKGFHARHLRGRFLFSRELNYNFLSKKFSSGGMIEKATFKDVASYLAFERENRTKFIPLFVVTPRKELQVFTTDSKLSPKPGDTLIYLSVNTK